MKLRSINDLVAGNLASAFVFECDLRLTLERDQFLVTVLDHLQVVEIFNSSVHRGNVLRLLFETGCTTNVEGTHRQLGSGLTDRLCSDDANGFTDLDRVTGREI